MIVLDASAMVEALVGADPDPLLLELMAGEIHAPHLLDIEVTSVVRGLERGPLARDRAEQALEDYWSFVIDRHDFEPVAERVWHLRHQFTSYDAAYIALAEAFDAPLVTCDRKLATSGHGAEVVVIERLQ